MHPQPLENERLSPTDVAVESLLPAAFAGLGAALVGGLAWTVLMAVTGYEIGYASWAIGALVGFAMSRTTKRRDAAAAGTAAALAIAGLVIARVLIGEFVLVDNAVEDILADQGLMAQAVAIDMQIQGTLPEGLQAEYDAIPEGDSVSDAFWADIMEASAERAAALDEGERVDMAERFSELVYADLGLVGRVTTQLGAFDVLWAFLAISTAWGAMKKKEEAGGEGGAGSDGKIEPGEPDAA